MDPIGHKLCDLQGRLFVNSLAAGFESEQFVRLFMRSKVAKTLDSKYNRLQWAGEEYMMDALQAEKELRKDGRYYKKERLYWMGYVYRYWHFYTGESSKDIVRIAPVRTLHKNYKEFRGQMQPDGLIDQLRESYFRKNPPKGEN